MFILSSISAIVFNGCGEVPVDSVPTLGRYSVVAVLSSDSEIQRLFIYSVFNASENRTPNEVFVSGAIVKVNDQQFIEMFDSTYQIKFYGLYSPNLVRHDNDYSLLIVVGSDTITGFTRSPGFFSITYPPTMTNVRISSPAETVLVRWQRSANARGYTIYKFDPPQRSPSNTEIIVQGAVSSWITKDTTTLVVMRNIGRHVLKVGAFDKYYEQHFMNGIPTAGLRGAYGVFASMVLDSIVVNVSR